MLMAFSVRDVHVRFVAMKRHAHDPGFEIWGVGERERMEGKERGEAETGRRGLRGYRGKSRVTQVHFCHQATTKTTAYVL